MARRPEFELPPEIFYDATEAQKYTRGARMIQVQSELAERCLELLALPEDAGPQLLLDIGCGSGLSGNVITEEGHYWAGFDISAAMLDVARHQEVEGSLVLSDMGAGLPFRNALFDGAISVSALQWLCNEDQRAHSAKARMGRFFTTLMGCLRSGARAAMQFYPADAQQIAMLEGAAAQAGFRGGVVTDWPNSGKARKHFLVLRGTGDHYVPRSLGVEGAEATPDGAAFVRRQTHKPARGQSVKKSRDWVLEKKGRARRQGREVREDTKFTGRKRKPRF